VAREEEHEGDGPAWPTGCCICAETGLPDREPVVCELCHKFVDDERTAAEERAEKAEAKLAEARRLLDQTCGFASDIDDMYYGWIDARDALLSDSTTPCPDDPCRPVPPRCDERNCPAEGATWKARAEKAEERAEHEMLNARNALRKIDELTRMLDTANDRAEKAQAERDQLRSDMSAERDGMMELRRRFGALDHETVAMFVERLHQAYVAWADTVVVESAARKRAEATASEIEVQLRLGIGTNAALSLKLQTAEAELAEMREALDAALSDREITLDRNPTTREYTVWRDDIDGGHLEASAPHAAAAVLAWYRQCQPATTHEPDDPCRPVTPRCDECQASAGCRPGCAAGSTECQDVRAKHMAGGDQP
jgi:hypothetical protein